MPKPRLAKVTEQESLQAAIHEGVVLRPYDPSWPILFERERDRLLGLFPGVFIDVQHIGSTAVPGLAAKPIIDIQAGVESMAAAERLSEPLCTCGYTTSAEFNASLTDRKWFMRWADGHRTHHLHVMVHDSSTWYQRLRFRDALRSSGDIANRYAALKVELAGRHRTDRDAYTEAKTEFVELVLSNRS